MKFGSKALAIVLLFVGLVLVNYLASRLPVRFDATADSIYSLSTGTKAMLGKIEEPVTLDLYFSKDVAGLPIVYKNYAARVQEMLRQYVRASRGRLTLNVINPRPDSPEEDKATAAGLTPQLIQQGGEQFFFGLTVTQADQQKNIPAFNPQRESFLEYDLSKLIYGVQQLDKRKLGLLSSLPLKGSSPEEMQMLMMSRQQPRPSQMVVNEWEQTFKIVPIEPDVATLPEGLDTLVVIHPENLPPRLQFAIDQFLLSGKPVVLAVDPSSQYFKRQANPQQQMMGQPAPNVSSDLPTLLNAYGISYDPQKIVGDLDNAAQVRTATGDIVRHPAWIKLGKANFNATSLLTSQLNSGVFAEAGSISLKPNAGLSFTPLVETSADSGDLTAMQIQFAKPEDLARQVVPSGKKIIAALISGKFKSAFPDGAPGDDPKKAQDPKKPASPQTSPSVPHLKESASTSMLFVVADTDWLFDDYIFDPSYRQMGLYMPMNDNLAFAANTLEYLGGSPDLISIRGKGSSLRPFTVVRAMELAAQKKYQEKLNDLDAQLADVQKKLNEVRGKKTEGNRLVATPEMTKIIADFQQQQAAVNRERRKIKLALTEDIDRLGNELLFMNLALPILAVGAFGLWFQRRRQK